MMVKAHGIWEDDNGKPGKLLVDLSAPHPVDADVFVGPIVVWAGNSGQVMRVVVPENTVTKISVV